MCHQGLKLSKSHAEGWRNVLYAIISPKWASHPYDHGLRKGTGVAPVTAPRCGVLGHCPQHCLRSLLLLLWKDRVYIASWADLSIERPWSLKWWEQLIYLCFLLCSYLLLVLTIKILTTFSNVDSCFLCPVKSSYHILPTHSHGKQVNLVFWKTIAFYCTLLTFFVTHSSFCF